ncbi:PREDICTED: uncharacterized protein LOC108371079 isoform X1 [Rhagoletis zephyria]|uniref:uncharacterized protein LOC108371079 isoform X1 n=1 Tax=Rhagoletis zephyria TaxID=28612 RepID=UPI000811A007|nr:PREDICTED: uncharacterized protein LOC108371079 isoform X1 [Rhagoletis zephyria]XP_017482070.1 PREDICTED: uncharacterized protein LOC108371079 isoform X1 [Rhagoletis zephyria]XP_017482077.1 PREDICTED: uncharacterized protein LOC108371079 isoform X1 [Rhagoletis zephyria]
MYISSLIAVCICVVAELGLAANVPARRERHELTISECAARGGECDETRGRPVCGTDEQTYPSRCHLLRVQCSGHQVSLKYRGPCKACKEARDYALKHKSRNPPKFIPRCKTDGTYAAIQCLGDTGCWCSDITGKPIENTSVRNGKPKCREYGKANIRRSPARHLSPSRGRRTCTAIDRAAFNANLIKVFQSEYIRAGQQKRTMAVNAGGGEGGFATPNDKLVLDWKFTYLDTNANQMLDKTEFRELKKLVKRAVKPRRCGRAFGKFCDSDDDDRLTLTEWNNCFSKDDIIRHSAAENKNYAVNSITSNIYHGYLPQQQNNKHNANSNGNGNGNGNNNINNRHALPAPFNHHPQQIHLNNHQPNHNTYSNSNNNNNNYNLNRNDNLNNIHHHASSALDELDSESNGDDDESSQRLDYEEDDYDPDEGEDNDALSMLNSSTIHYLRPNPDTQMNESDSESDCLADQKAALEEQRHGGTLFYVPECTADGRYQRVQCYRSTPYCWCVHEDTGKNIPGTSVKDKRPQCDTIYAAPRPMKGCPEPRKTMFLNDLKEFLKTHIVASAISGGNTTKWNSEDERIATLSFVLLDKNKNKSWERKEWKTFREMVTSTKTLRKCGKKMPRYCDVNSDKKITLTEWLNCLQTQRIEVQSTSQRSSTEANESITSKPLKLTGSNPLEHYLKE